MIDYLESYVRRFELPIAFDSAVRSLSSRDGRFVLALDDRVLEADQVIVATDPFHTPSVPGIAANLNADVFQTHSVGYRRPSDLPLGTALVVGGGNTGFQIAKEPSQRQPVYLAVGSRQTPLPQRLLGRDLFSWLTRFGLMEKTVESRIGPRPGAPRHADRFEPARAAPPLRTRATGVEGRTVSFADGSTLTVDAVIWATGFRPDYTWIDLPIVGADGRLHHRRGVTDSPGLYFLGLTWQHTRGSALLGWVSADAEFVTTQVAARADGAEGLDQVGRGRARGCARLGEVV